MPPVARLVDFCAGGAGAGGAVAVAAALFLVGVQPGGTESVAAGNGTKLKAPFTVVGKGNKPLFQVIEIQQAGGYMQLLDHQGHEICEAGFLADEGFREPNGFDGGLHGLQINGPTGEPFVFVEASEFSGEITLFDANGDLVFEAPEFPKARSNRVGGGPMHTEDRLAALEARLGRVEALEARIKTLEARAAGSMLRGRVMGAAGVFALAAALFTVGGKPGESQGIQAVRGTTTVKAPFRVVNNAGRGLFQIADSPGGGLLQVFDNAGRRVAQISSQGDVRGLTTYDFAGERSTFAGVELGDPGVEEHKVGVFDEEELEVITLAHIQFPLLDDLHGLLIRDDQENLRVFAGMEPFGNDVGFEVFDADFDQLVALGDLGEDQLLGLAIFGNDAQGNGLQVALESSTVDGGALTLFDEFGNVTFNAP